ncbi:MAG TPA: PAS domain-containing protein [Gemmatimonadales bacterium]
MADPRPTFSPSFDALPEALIALTPTYDVLFWNRAAEAIFGIAPEDALGRNLIDLIVAPDQANDVLVSIREATQAGQASFECDCRHANGSPVYVDVSLKVPQESEGRPYLVLCLRDVTQARYHRQAADLEARLTEQRRAEEALRHSLAMMRSVIEGTTDLVFVKDLEGRYLMVNSADAALIGKPADEIIGHTDQDLFPGKAAEAIRRAELEVIAEEKTRTYEESLSVKGKTRRFLSSKGIYRDPRGKVAGIFGISRDVTEAKQLEMQLRQAQKMEAVGRLAGGIAHDFNNVLSAILSYADLLAEDLSPKDPRRVDAQEISRAAHRAAGLTRQLLAFSRSQMLALKVLDLNEIVAGTDKMLRRIIGEDITLETRLAPELGHVRADPGQVEQVIMNLAVNARDAMPGGGRLTIETGNAVFDEQYRAVHEMVTPGDYVMLAVSDTGCGMDREEQSRIFEPFYTTKEPGKGTGLGLSTVYGIVKQSGGFIWVYSEPNQGATFKVYLPRVYEALDVVPPSPPASAPARGVETILLVEDEAPLRKVVHQILTRQGYLVLASSGGEEALRLARSHPGAIDLIATDVIMPGLGGRELVERLLALHPEASVLFMSGYTDDAVVHHGILERGTAFLQKPFSAAVLARKVREVLDSSESRIS